MSEKHNDEDAYEQYLAGNSRLSNVYVQLSRETPSAAVDKAIIAAASEAQQAGKTRRWRVTTPLATAAIVVLGVTLLLRTQDFLTRDAPHSARTKTSDGDAQYTSQKASSPDIDRGRVDAQSDISRPPLTPSRPAPETTAPSLQHTTPKKSQPAAPSIVTQQTPAARKAAGGSSAQGMVPENAEVLGLPREEISTQDRAATRSQTNTAREQDNAAIAVPGTAADSSRRPRISLSEIRAWYEAGQIERARDGLARFRETRPAVSEAAIATALGAAYNALVVTAAKPSTTPGAAQ